MSKKQHLAQIEEEMGFEMFTDYFKEIVNYVIENHGYEYIEDIIKQPTKEK